MDQMISVAASEETSISTTNAAVVASNHPLEFNVFYFGGEILIQTLGFFGTISNGLVLYIMMTSASRKKTTNILLINQVVLDMVSCISVTITQASLFKVERDFPSGILAILSCYIVQGQVFGMACLAGSITNLFMITLERYIKIVYSIFHRKYFRKWMVYLVVAITWLSAVLQTAGMFVSSRFVWGICFPFTFWPSDLAQKFYMFSELTLQFIIPVSMFIFAYSHIYVVLRRSSKVFQAPDELGTQTAPQAKVSRAETKVIKLFFIITVIFVVCWTPNQYYYMEYVGYGIYSFGNSFTVVQVLAYLSLCINPFIYATNHIDVKKRFYTIFHIKSNQAVTTIVRSTGTD